MSRLRGFKTLLQTAVDQGSRAIERVQIETAKVPFNLVERVPGLEVPGRGVRLIYNTGVSGVHEMIRLVNKVAGDTIDVVLDTVDPQPPASHDGEPRPTPETPADPGKTPPAG